MCLRIKRTQKPKVAGRNIGVYKVILNLDGCYRTLYQMSYTCPGYVAESKIIVEEGYFGDKIDVALHSFKDLETANNCKVLYPNAIIIKCIIPKRSIYYLGEFYKPNDSYASNKLIYPKSFKPVQ